jgi:hypothetical protein
MLYGSDFSDASLAAAILVCGAGIGATVSVPAAFTIADRHPRRSAGLFVLVRLLGAVPASEMAHFGTLLGRLPQALKVPLRQALSLIGTSRAA